MIDKVITSLQDADNMQEINLITGLDICSTDNWVDLATFEENPELQKEIDEKVREALRPKEENVENTEKEQEKDKE